MKPIYTAAKSLPHLLHGQHIGTFNTLRECRAAMRADPVKFAGMYACSVRVRNADPCSCYSCVYKLKKREAQ